MVGTRNFTDDQKARLEIDGKAHQEKRLFY